MFASSIRKTIQPYLGTDEELLAAVPAQNAGANHAAMVSALRGPLATGRALDAAERRLEDARVAAQTAALEVDRRMVVAVTSQRLLILRAGGAFTVKVQELLGEAPIADVDGIDVEPDGRLTKSVTLRVLGSAIVIETARGMRPEELVDALASARGALRRVA